VPLSLGKLTYKVNHPLDGQTLGKPA